MTRSTSLLMPLTPYRIIMTTKDLVTGDDYCVESSILISIAKTMYTT